MRATDEGTFKPSGGIVVHGYEGNDVLLVCGVIGPVQLYGDAGNDCLVDGPDGGILFGGTGDVGIKIRIQTDPNPIVVIEE